MTISPFSIDLNVIKSCNFSCDYCYEFHSDQGTEKFNIELLHNFFDYIENLLNSEYIANNHSGIQINFWGGEPTLNMSLIEKVIQHFKMNRRINFYLFTNGYHIEPIIEMYKRLELNKTIFQIQVSYDGFKIHEKRRKLKNGNPTHEIILSNIIKLFELDFPFSIKSTVTWQDFDNLTWSYFEFLELHKKYQNTFCGSRMNYYPTIDTDTRLWESDQIQCTEAFTNSVREIAKEDLLYHQKNGRPFFRWFHKNKMCCTAGSSSAAINVNGDILTCHGCFYLDKELELFIGNITEHDCINKTLQNVDYFKKFVTATPRECLTCEALFCARCNAHCYKQSQYTGLISKWTDYTAARSCKYYQLAGKIFKSVINGQL